MDAGPWVSYKLAGEPSAQVSQKAKFKMLLFCLTNIFSVSNIFIVYIVYAK